MKLFSFGKLFFLVTLFSVVVTGTTVEFNGLPITWQLFVIPIFASIFVTVLLWWRQPYQNPAVDDQEDPNQSFVQKEKISSLKSDLESAHEEIDNLEKALAQAKESAEQASQARTTFLNNMGHELRTPLSVILGYADMILQKAEREGDEGLLVLAQKMKRYAKDFSAVINDVLRMSEIESGQVGFLLEAFYIENVVEQAVKQIQTYLDVNDNDLMMMIPNDIGTMFADRDKVRIVLVNLLSNAAKFTENGTVTLSVTKYLIEDQAWIIFQISDTGIGMLPEKQELIFQPFLQDANYVTKEHEGAGLGLSINQHYCQLMGGRIEVESSPGNGSTFSVYLPAEVTAVESMYVREASKLRENQAPIND